ncbi:MAG: hypothetical protein U9O96_04650 [Candidatus Thermoplasmatota archaeon]|nr:hypothetical protein [Candidatus Thermoplasmatota archaeon]
MKKMRKAGIKIVLCLFVVILLSVSGVSVVLSEHNGHGKINDWHDFYINGYEDVISDIEMTKDKVLDVDKVIGDRYVMYWKHMVDGFEVKNDSILLHLDGVGGEVVEYKKQWRDITFSFDDFDIDYFEPIDYFWKKPVIFVDEKDLGYFYTFYNNQDYPTVCLEVRQVDGTTVLYDFEGNIIGDGISTPSEKGFSLNGYDKEVGPGCWMSWRINADRWFKVWCDSTVSLASPTTDVISFYVGNKNVTFFYEIAHGGSYSFLASFDGSEYYYYDSTILREDMANREQIKFAFIGSCDGMTETGPDTLSYEFRKGQMTDTVTIGYTGMGSHSGWSVSLPWQGEMFKRMNDGFRVKKAFDIACAEYPTIASAVKFVGDETLRIVDNHPPEKPQRPIGRSEGRINWLYVYSTSSSDLDGENLSYWFDWGGGTDSGWLGPYPSGETIRYYNWWIKDGNYNIRVKAKDEYGAESEWSDPLSVSMPKSYENTFAVLLEKIFGRNIFSGRYSIFNLLFPFITSFLF